MVELVGFEPTSNMLAINKESQVFQFSIPLNSILKIEVNTVKNENNSNIHDHYSEYLKSFCDSHLYQDFSK